MSLSKWNFIKIEMSVHIRTVVVTFVTIKNKKTNWCLMFKYGSIRELSETNGFHDVHIVCVCVCVCVVPSLEIMFLVARRLKRKHTMGKQKKKKRKNFVRDAKTLFVHKTRTKVSRYQRASKSTQNRKCNLIQLDNINC